MHSTEPGEDRAGMPSLTGATSSESCAFAAERLAITWPILEDVTCSSTHTEATAFPSASPA